MKSTRRILSLTAALCMVFSSVQALAEGQQDAQNRQQDAQEQQGGQDQHQDGGHQGGGNVTDESVELSAISEFVYGDLMYETGDGVEQSYDKAIKYYGAQLSRFQGRPLCRRAL